MRTLARLRRILFIALAAAVLLTAVSCGGKPEESQTDPTSSTGGSASQSEIPEGESTSEVTGEGTGEGTGNGNGDGAKTTKPAATTTRPIADTAITAPNKKEEVVLSKSMADRIKRVKDNVIKETVKNMGGKTFKLAAFDSGKFQKGNPHPYSEYYSSALAAIMKDYNCKIEHIHYKKDTVLADISTQKAAGKVYANILDAQIGLNSIIRDGVLANLRTVNSVDLVGNEWNPAFLLTSTYKDGIYGVGVNQSEIHSQGLFFNKRIAEEYNLGDFYQMVMDKKWTFSKFLSISKDVYTKSNRKVFGLETIAAYWMGNFVYADGSSPVTINSSKKVMFNKKDDRLLNTLDFVYQYSKMGLLDRATYQKVTDYATGKGLDNTSGWKMFTTGKSLFFMASDDWATHCLSSNMDDDYGFLPLPIGPDAKDYIRLVSDAVYFGLFNEDPNIEDSGIILKAIANRTNIKMADWEKSMALIFRDQKSIEMEYLLMNSDPVILAGGDFSMKGVGGLIDYNNIAIPAIALGQQTPKQALDAIAGSVQVTIDRYYGN